jgi:threonylcarbamoyladenosine tRNA methylthiotransferase MtaB
LIEKCGFADMHIFPYSRRPGTPADKMPGQHNNATKDERSKAAIAVAAKMSEDYRRNLIGTTHAVLFDEMEGDFFTGHAPNYVRIYAEGTDLHNKLASVKITGVFRDGVLGEIVGN